MDECFCQYCHRPCSPNGFCDETCYDDYKRELKIMEEILREDYMKEISNDD